mmetsp:Transcript_53681/g.141500  ORF Transcript_53681/g.141500 Transcript_53681/m.141500 type:complete len:343 (+) Transcript_53681:128-1156(+)
MSFSSSTEVRSSVQATNGGSKGHAGSLGVGAEGTGVAQAALATEVAHVALQPSEDVAVLRAARVELVDRLLQDVLRQVGKHGGGREVQVAAVQEADNDGVRREVMRRRRGHVCHVDGGRRESDRLLLISASISAWDDGAAHPGHRHGLAREALQASSDVAILCAAGVKVLHADNLRLDRQVPDHLGCLRVEPKESRPRLAHEAEQAAPHVAILCAAAVERLNHSIADLVWYRHHELHNVLVQAPRLCEQEHVVHSLLAAATPGNRRDDAAGGGRYERSHLRNRSRILHHALDHAHAGHAWHAVASHGRADQARAGHAVAGQAHAGHRHSLRGIACSGHACGA